MRPSRPAAIAVIVGSLAAVGCMNTEPKEPLGLGNDTRAALGGGSSTAAAKSTKTASFDPSATGGSGLSVKNAFNRPVPSPGTDTGTGTASGDFASRLPPPQIGQQPAAVAPVRDGVSYAKPSEEQGRTSMTTRAAPPASIPPVAPPATPVATAPPAGPSPFSQTAPKLDAPVNDPPIRQAIAIEPAPPTPPAPPKSIPPVVPEPERAPMPTPTIPERPAATIPPVAPPIAGAAANESLPVAPSVVPSPNVVPISGLEPTPKIPPAPPILPNR